MERCLQYIIINQDGGWSQILADGDKLFCTRRKVP